MMRDPLWINDIMIFSGAIIAAYVVLSVSCWIIDRWPRR
jgi:hypothetical protein